MDNPIRLNWLDPRDPDQPFPPAHLAMRDPNGLLAIGGDLSAERLIRAYSQGIFPWFNPDEPILWWCPDPRAVLVPRECHVSHSLAKRLRQGRFAVTFDHAFRRVMAYCAAPRAGSRGTWLSPAMQDAYAALHARGTAHSVEVWVQGELAGGLYGVALGRAFFGESMFSMAPDMSKIALVMLARQLDAWGFALIDCQIASRHLESLGARAIPRRGFLAQLRAARQAPPRNGPWRFDIDVSRGREHLPW
ncbi:MAG: leucyl/phenylalanyl-tRNA--protein transferase [Nevskiaceae bacterium]|nr:MAG: leucyl/phenylalanyl-tRNA--protein transferase [Nevskiaceae bacterium]TBR73402.1 MAG: leucyl/phenylalanyl-tRNA--protein transferase [Nevskiaceae bacterium]